MSYTINSTYRAKYYGKTVRSLTDIKYVVMHYTANTGTSATAQGNAIWFSQSTRKASAHYCVRSGEPIYYCVPLEYPAWSVGDNSYSAANGGATLKGICTNQNSVSIEMVSCSDSSGEYYIPEATQNLAAELAANLVKQLGLTIDNVVRHYDVTGKLCPEPMSKTFSGVDKTSAWKAFKAKVSANLSGYSGATSSTSDVSYESSSSTGSGVREFTIAQDGDNISRWGVLQKTAKLSDGENAKTKAETLLKSYDTVQRNLTINNAFGNIAVRAGVHVPVILNIGDKIVSQFMLVESAEHTFSAGHHSMTLKLRGGDDFTT